MRQVKPRHPSKKPQSPPEWERKASKNRRNGKRSSYSRCPQCKKLRKRWFSANYWHPGRKRWGILNGQRACHICIERATPTDGIKPA